MIKERLLHQDAGVDDAGAVADGEAADGDDVSATDEIADAPTGLQMSLEEMSTATGIDRDRIKELEAFGIISTHGPEGARYYDGDDFIILSIVKDFFRWDRGSSPHDVQALRGSGVVLLRPDRGADPLGEKNPGRSPHRGPNPGEPVVHVAEVQAGAPADEPARQPSQRVKRRRRRRPAFLPSCLIVQASWLHDRRPGRAAPDSVPPNGSPSPFVSRLSTPADPVPVRIDAPAVVLMDLAAGQVLYQRAAASARPVASLTKLMTALLVLEAEEGRLDRTVRVDPDAVFGQAVRDGVVARPASGRAGLGPGLLGGLLLGSANDAAEALAIEESGSVGAFVTAMNARARPQDGGDVLRFPHGLDDRGLSSASDILVAARVRRHTAFRRLVASRNVVVRSDSAPPRRIQVATCCCGSIRGFRREDRVYGGRRVLPRRDGSTRRAIAAVVLGGRDEVFSRRPRS